MRLLVVAPSTPGLVFRWSCNAIMRTNSDCNTTLKVHCLRDPAFWDDPNESLQHIHIYSSEIIPASKTLDKAVKMDLRASDCISTFISKTTHIEGNCAMELKWYLIFG